MNHGLLDICRNAGDQNLGQTLVRLAGLASVAHQYRQAQIMSERPSPVSALTGKDQYRVEGLDPRGTPTGAASRAATGQSAHTEVSR